MNAPTNYPARLGAVAAVLSQDTGIAMPKLMDYLCNRDIMTELLIQHSLGSTRLTRMRRDLSLPADAGVAQIAWAVGELVVAHKAPVDLVLHCPACKTQHIDGYEDSGWTNPPHKTHKCHQCGERWTPSDRPTNGVRAVKPGNSSTWPKPDVTLFSADKLPARDECGMVYHPDLPDIGEEEIITPYLWAMGYECSFIDFDGDAPQALQDAYGIDLDVRLIAQWVPTTPEGGWRLAAIYDTENGAYALFVRPRDMPPDAKGDA